MGRYFGTDGIRGKANETLSAEMAFLTGRYLGYIFSKEHKGKILIGKDTRISSSMYEMAVAAGAVSQGADVYFLGTCPTPAVTYLVLKDGFDCGVMISASHNPYYDNGIKVFNNRGLKLESSIEDEIEDYLDGKTVIEYAVEDKIGSGIDYSCGLNEYLDWLDSMFDLDLSGMKLAIDCANGSSSVTAERLLKRKGASVTAIHCEPNGVNINNHCGSTHPEELQELIRNGSYDLGLAFDGDADRLIAVNSHGELLNGDYILYICGKYLDANAELKDHVVVSTVMANLGFFKALEKCGLKSVSTQVGDKYVVDCMEKNNYGLGGEQSGHIIFKKHATTGDGLLTALKLLEVMKKTGKSIEELSEGLNIFPQLLVNQKVKDKTVVLNDEEIKAAIDQVAAELGTSGRILVRPSGTEPLIRVMVEAETEEICHHYVYKILDLIQEKGY